MKKLLLAILLLSVNFSCLAADNITQDDLSCIIKAKSGHISSLDSDHYQLLLEDVDPYVTCYTRRPNRVRTPAPTINFVKAWKSGDNSFEENNPNATLITAKTDDVVNINPTPLIIQLSSPKYDGHSEMSFVIAPVGDTEELIVNQLNLKGIVLVVN